MRTKIFILVSRTKIFILVPAEAIAVAVVADGILDFFNTSCNLSSLQLELIFGANDSGMLDKDVLRKRV